MIIPLLTKLPWIASALGFFKNKKRLVIEYVLLAVLVAVAGFTFTMWLQKERTENALAKTQGELSTVQSRLTLVEAVNTQQEQTITDLKELRLEDAKALGGLLTDYKSLAENDARVRRRLSNLEQTNEAVRNYLNQPIPPELVCVLHGTCETGNQDRAQGGKGSPAGSAGAAVHGSKPAPAGTDKRPR